MTSQDLAALADGKWEVLRRKLKGVSRGSLEFKVRFTNAIVDFARSENGPERETSVAPRCFERNVEKFMSAIGLEHGIQKLQTQGFDTFDALEAAEDIQLKDAGLLPGERALILCRLREGKETASSVASNSKSVKFFLRKI